MVRSSLRALSVAADAAHFEQDQSNRKFYDPDFKSCTSFIAMIAQQRFGFDPSPVADLVHWADVIDGALYADAKTAVEMKAPAMKLTMVIESAPDPNFVPNLIPLLADKSLAEILESRSSRRSLPPLLERHELSIEILKERTECKDGTIFFDVTDHDLEGYNKFVPYYLHPESIYSVGLSKSSFRVKVSVGSNPWAPRRTGGESGEDLRALRRRRACARGRDQLRTVTSTKRRSKRRGRSLPNCAPRCATDTNKLLSANYCRGTPDAAHEAAFPSAEYRITADWSVQNALRP